MAKPETKKKQVHSETWNGVKHMQILRLYVICSIWNPILLIRNTNWPEPKARAWNVWKTWLRSWLLLRSLGPNSGREQIQNCETLVAPLVYKTFYSWSQAATVVQTEAQRPMLWKEKSSHAAVIFKYGSTELVCARWWARLAIVAGVFCSTGRATMNVSVKGPNDGKMSYR